MGGMGAQTSHPVIEWQNKQKIRASHGHSTEELLPWAKMPRLTKDEAWVGWVTSLGWYPMGHCEW